MAFLVLNKILVSWIFWNVFYAWGIKFLNWSFLSRWFAICKWTLIMMKTFSTWFISIFILYKPKTTNTLSWLWKGFDPQLFEKLRFSIARWSGSIKQRLIKFFHNNFLIFDFISCFMWILKVVYWWFFIWVRYLTFDSGWKDILVNFLDFFDLFFKSL